MDSGIQRTQITPPAAGSPVQRVGQRTRRDPDGRAFGEELSEAEGRAEPKPTDDTQATEKGHVAPPDEDEAGSHLDVVG